MLILLDKSDQTSAEIESHKKEGTYLETEAVRQCIQLLECRNVVILSGREGSGKSRNGLEILRQLKERHTDSDVFKLTGLHYVSDIVKCNVTTIVLFDDVFDKTSEQISSDEQVLNHLYSYISKNKVKVIFTMRNYVRHACHRLLSTHKIFRDFVDIDLNSKKFKLTAKEKEEMVTNYCTINKIRISEKKKDATDQSVVNEDERAEPEVNQLEPAEAAVILKRETMNEIIETDPFLGFPECCRLFTENRNSTTLDVSCFKWPSAALVNDIEKLRMEGINNYMNGLKYVILIHILTLGYSREKCQEYDSETDCSLVKRKIDAQDCKHIFKICYNMVLEVHTSHIEYVCKVLTERYLVYQDGAYYFQHKAIQDSVLISYNKINPNATIPLLTFGHLIDIVYSQNYIEQKDQIVIKISEPCYPALAKKIILILNSLSFQIDCYRLKESKLFTENDIDLVYQLILGIENEKDHHRHVISNYLGHFIPLYLLRNIGKLNDKMLTVKHTKDQMLISVTIVDKNIALSIDPQTSLIKAYYSNCIDILKWLLKHTDHTLLDFAEMFQEIKPDEFLEYTKLLLENVKHNMINMTNLLIETCFKCNSKENYKLDWIVDNVDNSLIDYHTCIEELLNQDCTDIKIHILKKVNHRWLNVKAIGKLCCEYGCSEIVIWLLKNINHKLFDEEELLNIMIDEFERDEDLFDNKIETLVELLILQKPEIICCSVNKLFPIANRSRWYDVLELIFKYASILSINKDRMIEDLFEYRYDEEQDCNVNGDFEEVHFDDEHCHKIFELIIKYPLHDIDVNKLFKKAVEGGLHKIVEELFNEKLNNISQYLDITLNKLRRRQFHQYYDFEDCNVGHGKILILLLQKTNNKSIDLNSIMNDVCHIGYSPVILWLLENKPSCYFDIRKVMNKVCYHGNLELVKYLTQKYRTEDFDLKTAMIKACRSSNSNFICKWLWKNHDRRMLDMKAALNNASRCDNTDVVEWILTEVDTELYDTEDALLCACEHGADHTVELLLDTVGFNMINFQYATTLACRNKNSGLAITKRLFMRTKKSHLNMNAVLSDACKNYRTDIIQWIIENCVQNIPVTETSDRNKHFIKHLDTNFVDISWLITCILDMDLPRQNTGNFDDKKYTLLLLILNKSNPRTIDIHKLLTESSRKNWIEIFKWIFLNGSIELSNIREATNTACHNGSLSIVKWSLENIEANILDLGNIMRESCGYGWLECLDLLKKHFNRYKFDMKAAMFEACTYNRPHIAEWLLHNVSYQHFDIRLILQEAGRNGWINIFGYLLQNFHFDKSDIHIATRHALENGHLEIAELGITKIGKEDFDFSSLSKNAYVGANKEGVVNFLLHNIDPKSIDIATIMTNACLFGWKDIVTFIIDNDLSNLCDLSLAFNTACDNGELESAQLLLEKVDPHILISVDKAMYSVAVKGWDEIALLLLDKVEHTRLDIGNALIEACRHGEIDVVQAILRKVDNNMLDVKTAINKACENHMHEELVLWILENIDQEQVDLKTVKIQAVRHKWWKVQLALNKVDTENLNAFEQVTETDNIIFLE